MTMHAPHPDPSGRPEFLVDGCPRCEEYVEDMGIYFDPERWRAFWRKMIDVEFDYASGYMSHLDKRLGHRLFLVALSMERATGLDPRRLLDVRAVMVSTPSE